ncbi:MAG: hypothetical protein RL235_570, partial [Chlamydiota bacterium]
MLLGEFSHHLPKQPRFQEAIEAFRSKEAKGMSVRARSEKVSQTLLKLIQEAKEPAFLLPDVVSFIAQIDSEGIVRHYTLSGFELWLNQYSKIPPEENSRVRGKIVGKWIDRSDYQGLFPIGMGKTFPGSHFVTAHKSPDLDTTVASFWGWVDAFAARVGDGLHVWNVPGGPPQSQIEIQWLFRDFFGDAIFTHVAKTKAMLALTAFDLMTQKGVHRKLLTDSITSVDHDRDHYAVVIVDE